jgi:hypothetical protein
MLMLMEEIVCLERERVPFSDAPAAGNAATKRENECRRNGGSPSVSRLRASSGNAIIQMYR